MVGAGAAVIILARYIAAGTLVRPDAVGACGYAAVIADIYALGRAFDIAFLNGFACRVVFVAAVWAFHRICPEAVMTMLFIIFAAFHITHVIALDMSGWAFELIDIFDVFACRMFVVASAWASDLFPFAVCALECG